MKKILRLSFLFLFMLNTCLFAQSGTATVDTRLLLILHPLMKDFDYSIGRFYKESPKDKNASEIYDMLRKAKEESDEKRLALEEKGKELEQQKFDLTMQLERAQNVLAPGDAQRFAIGRKNLQRTLAELEKAKPFDEDQKKLNDDKIKYLKDQIQELDDLIDGNYQVDEKKSKATVTELKDKIKNVEELIKINKNEIFEVEENAISSVYYTFKETNERVEKAKNEIQDLISKAAKNGKFSCVIDTSFAMRNVNRKRRRNTISVVEDSPDTISSSLFHFFTNLEVNDEILNSMNMPMEDAQKHAVAGRSIGMKSNLKQYLEFRNYIPAKLANFTNGRIFLAGGNDITVSVATDIFNQYNIPEPTKKMLLQTIKDYISFDVVPSIQEFEF